MLNHAAGGFHSSSSVSCHAAGASSHSPVAIASNASVCTAQSSSARALAYSDGHRASAPGQQVVASAASVSAMTRSACTLYTRPRYMSRRTTVSPTSNTLT